MGRAHTFSFQYLPSTPRISLTCFSSCTFFLSASLSLSSSLSFTSVLHPPNFSTDSSTYSWSPPKPSIFFDYVIPSYSSSRFCYFLSYSPINYGWQPLFRQFFTYYSPFNFLTSLFVLSGYIPSSVLLVVLEHPSICLAAVICAVSSFFTNFVFPSHTSPAYSNFGTITSIRIHYLIPVSRCGSVRIASILPTCDLPFQRNMCASQGHSFKISRSGEEIARTPQQTMILERTTCGTEH